MSKTNVDQIYLHAQDWVRNNCRTCLFGDEDVEAVDDDADMPRNCDILAVLVSSGHFNEDQATRLNAAEHWARCPFKIAGKPQQDFTLAEYGKMREKEAELLRVWRDLNREKSRPDYGQYAYYTNDPEVAMCYVHYSDKQWYGSEGRAIFGDPNAPYDGCADLDRLTPYVCDSLYQEAKAAILADQTQTRWLSESSNPEDFIRHFAFSMAWSRYPKVAGNGDGMSASRLANILSDVLGYRVVVTAVVAGVRAFGGYSWHSYYWRKEGKDA